MVLLGGGVSWGHVVMLLSSANSVHTLHDPQRLDNVCLEVSLTLDALVLDVFDTKELLALTRPVRQMRTHPSIGRSCSRDLSVAIEVRILNLTARKQACRLVTVS